MGSKQKIEPDEAEPTRDGSGQVRRNYCTTGACFRYARVFLTLERQAVLCMDRFGESALANNSESHSIEKVLCATSRHSPIHPASRTLDCAACAWNHALRPWTTIFFLVGGGGYSPQSSVAAASLGETHFE